MGSRDGKLFVFDGTSFNLLASIDFHDDVDGQGFISVFEQSDADHYHLLADIPSALGARTAGYAAKIGKKGRDRFYLGAPARSGQSSAEVWIYQAQE